MNTRKSLLRSGAVAVVAVLFAALFASSAQAVPAFARRYGTSCQTCHIAFPKLNNFGEAFRLLGYHLPGESEAQVKQPDVPLGADAYKRVWPNAVWPGAIPGSVPLSLVGEFQVVNSSQLEDGEKETVSNDFVFPSEVALVAAGSAGDNVSYFGEIAWEQEVEGGVRESETEVEHIDVRLVHLLKSSPAALNFKIGAFQPELVSTFDHARRLTVANYDSMFGVQPAHPGGAEAVGGDHHGGGGGVALPVIVRGIEGFGVVRHRLLWSAGVVNGIEPGQETFDANNRKDVYARLAYKWGGLAPDGSNADSFAGSDKNWREQSFRVGLFAYQGDGSGILSAPGGDEHGEEGEHEEEPSEHSAAFVEDETYSRVGVDFNWFYKDLNVFGGYVRGRDDLDAFAADELDPGMPGERLDELSGEFTYKAWFVEADAVLKFPWLHGALRYEKVSLPSEESDGFERGTASVTGLVRANLKVTAEYTWDLNESDNYSAWLNLVMAF